MRRVCRQILFAVAAIHIAGLAGSGARAQPTYGDAPWCVNMSMYGGLLDCNYHTFGQCMATAIGVSNQCSRNPWYVEPLRPRPRVKRKSRR
jgi:hypothetical protein